MGRIISFLLCAVLILSFSFSTVSAKEENAEEVIIEFVYEDNISDELKAKIEAHLLNGDNQNARGLGCILFGHDLVSVRTEKITHKARTTAPRCLIEQFNVETCEDCDYTNSTLVSSSYIYCCS